MIFRTEISKEIMKFHSFSDTSERSTMELPRWKVCFSFKSTTKTFMYIHATEIYQKDNLITTRMKIGKIIDGRFKPKRSLVNYIVKICCSYDRYGYLEGDENIGGEEGPVFVDRLWAEL